MNLWRVLGFPHPSPYLFYSRPRFEFRRHTTRSTLYANQAAASDRCALKTYSRRDVVAFNAVLAKIFRRSRNLTRKNDGKTRARRVRSVSSREMALVQRNGRTWTGFLASLVTRNAEPVEPNDKPSVPPF